MTTKEDEKFNVSLAELKFLSGALQTLGIMQYFQSDGFSYEVKLRLDSYNQALDIMARLMWGREFRCGTVQNANGHEICNSFTPLEAEDANN